MDQPFSMANADEYPRVTARLPRQERHPESLPREESRALHDALQLGCSEVLELGGRHPLEPGLQARSVWRAVPRLELSGWASQRSSI
jgi:hypothetical protein